MIIFLKRTAILASVSVMISASAQAEINVIETGSLLQQQYRELEVENQRLVTELNRLQSEKHCGPVSPPLTTAEPTRRWLYMTEHFGLPIVGF